MSSPAAGPLFVAAALLGVSGIAKLVSPAGTARALDSARLPGGAVAGRLLGLAEVVLATWTFARGDRLAAAAVAGAYLVFAGFTARLVRQGAGAGCGCFGADESPATWTHVGVDLLLASAAAWAVADPPGSVASVVTDQPLAGVPLLALVALGTWLGYVALTLLPDLQAAVGEGHDDGGEGAG